MIKGFIYCAISPSGKKYYGYSNCFESRKRRHKRDYLKGTKTCFYDAIRKYTWDEFKWEIKEIHYSDNKESLYNELKSREKYWISKEKTYLRKFGYNMTLGGDGRTGSPNSPEVMERIKKSLTGRITERNGKTYKEEMIEKYGEEIGLIKLNKWKDELSKSHNKPILQFDKNDVLIREWESSTIASSKGGFEGTNIVACLKGRRKTHAGFKWKYKH